LACAIFAFTLSGCETNDYFNPAEPPIVSKDAKPLVVPILDTLDKGVEDSQVTFPQAQDVSARDLIPSVSDYTIGKTDTVSVSIFDLLGEGTGETPKVVRVSETGMISLPFIPPVKAEGLTEHQLELAVIKAYQDAKLIKNARVTVQVVEARARTFSIQGNVGAAGEYQITRPDFRMLDAMVTAHAPNVSIGADYAYIIRKISAETPTPPPATEPSETPGSTPPATPPGDLLAPQSSATPVNPGHTMLMDQPAGNNNNLLAPGSDEGASGMIEGKPAPGNPNLTEPTNPTDVQPAAPGEAAGGFEFNAPKEPSDVRIIRVPIDQLRQYGQLKYNVVIRPGDMIIVPDPQTGTYYMAGHVQRSGVYSLTGTHITLKQAWSAAGGGDDLAIPHRTEIIRRISPDKEVVVRIDMIKIWNFEQPDMYLRPNDIVWVGTDIWAPFIASIRNSFRLTYGFGFLYDRNFGPTGSSLF
jgi:protein involved in polysaccharide export with SLBB domain